MRREWLLLLLLLLLVRRWSGEGRLLVAWLRWVARLVLLGRCAATASVHGAW